jgi:hypothetical protein
LKHSLHLQKNLKEQAEEEVSQAKAYVRQGSIRNKRSMINAAFCAPTDVLATVFKDDNFLKFDFKQVLEESGDAIHVVKFNRFCVDEKKEGKYEFQVTLANSDVSVAFFKRSKDPEVDARLVLVHPTDSNQNATFWLFKKFWKEKVKNDPRCKICYGSRKWMTKNEFKEFIENGKVAYGVK